jgi:hypothetical protein
MMRVMCAPVATADRLRAAVRQRSLQNTLASQRRPEGEQHAVPAVRPQRQHQAGRQCPRRGRVSVGHVLCGEPCTPALVSAVAPGCTLASLLVCCRTLRRQAARAMCRGATESGCLPWSHATSAS